MVPEAPPLNPGGDAARPWFAIDTHCDTPTASLARPGWDLGTRHDHAADGSQVDLPRMVAGGVDAMVFATYVGQAARSPEGLAMAPADGLDVAAPGRAIGLAGRAIAAPGLAVAPACCATDGLAFA